MAWFGAGSGSRRAKPERARRFEQADRVVVEAFADLHEAHHLRSKFPAMSRVALQQFERKAWNRLIDYLIQLPPLPSDDWSGLRCREAMLGARSREPSPPRLEVLFGEFPKLIGRTGIVPTWLIRIRPRPTRRGMSSISAIPSTDLIGEMALYGIACS